MFSASRLRLLALPILASAGLLALPLAAAENSAKAEGGAPELAPSPPTRAALDTRNVSGLRLAFALRTERSGAEAGAPATAHGLLFVLSPFPHTLYAIDPAAAPSARVKWQYSPKADRTADGLACCERSEHGPLVAGSRIFFTTLDGHVVSLDVDTGDLHFDVVVTDASAGETLSGPPTLTPTSVLVGNSGGDFGVRGWVAALDVETGRTLWKRYSTGPDAEVGIGPGFTPYYTSYRGVDLGVSTWPPAAWQQGGGSVATPILYDPASQLVFHGTGHPAPWNAEQRTGDNLWTSGMFARDATTGAARWFDALNPNGPFAYQGENADLLVDRVWQGRARRLLVHADANGLLYVFDRMSGQILAADPFVASVVAGVDLQKGRTTYRADKIPRVNRQTRDICPAWTGAVGNGMSSMVPDTNTVILPLSLMCMDIEPRAANYIPGTPFTGANVRMRFSPVSAGGVLAWDLQARRATWRVNERLPVLGGALTTSGGLIFYGTLDSKLKALDARTGALLWQSALPAGVMSRPTLLRGTDGREYLALLAGTGRIRGMSRTESLDPRDATAGFGLAPLVESMAADTDPSGVLLVYTLP